MVVVHIQKGMGQRAAREGVRVGAVLADQLTDGGEIGGLDLHALPLDQLAVFIDAPDALRRGICGGHQRAVRNGAHGGVGQAAGKEIVEAVPLPGILIPSGIQPEALVLPEQLQIFLRPAFRRGQVAAPAFGVGMAPAGNRLVVLQGRIVVSQPLQLLQRLVHQKPEIVHRLVNVVVQGGVVPVLQHVPRHTGGRPIQKIIQLVNALRRVGVGVRIDCRRCGQRFFHQGHQFRVRVQQGLQLLGHGRVGRRLLLNGLTGGGGHHLAGRCAAGGEQQHRRR